MITKENASEYGKKGGRALVNRYGMSYMHKIALDGGNVTALRLYHDDPDYYARIGRKGGLKRAENLRKK